MPAAVAVPEVTVQPQAQTPTIATSEMSIPQRFLFS